MREEHNQKVIAQSEYQSAVAADAMKKREEEKAENTPKKDFGFITIAAGEGLAEIFKGLGVDEVIQGGQTMNPSTEDILNAAEKINATQYLFFQITVILFLHLIRQHLSLKIRSLLLYQQRLFLRV